MYINDRFVRFYPRIFSPFALYVVTYLQSLVYSLDLSLEVNLSRN